MVILTKISGHFILEDCYDCGVTTYFSMQLSGSHVHFCWRKRQAPVSTSIILDSQKQSVCFTCEDWSSVAPMLSIQVLDGNVCDILPLYVCKGFMFHCCLTTSAFCRRNSEILCIVLKIHRNLSKDTTHCTIKIGLSGRLSFNPGNYVNKALLIGSIKACYDFHINYFIQLDQYYFVLLDSKKKSSYYWVRLSIRLLENTNVHHEKVILSFS